MKSHGDVYLKLHITTPTRPTSNWEEILKTSATNQQTVSSCLRILQDSRSSLETQLRKALSLLEFVDSDLALGLDTAYREVEDLMDRTAFVFMGYVLGASQMRSALLPSLQTAISKAKRHSAASLLGVAQASFAEMRQSLQDLRSAYADVTGLLVCSASQLEVALSKVGQKTDSEVQGCLTSSACLQAALSELECTADMLQEYSVLGRMLCRHDEDFAVFVGYAQHLRSTLVSCSRACRPFQGCEKLCAQIELFCSRYCAGCPVADTA